MTIGVCATAQNKRTLSLEECIEIAIDNNLNVQRSELNLQSAEVNLMQSKAQRYPTLNASGNYGYTWGRGIDPTTNQFIDQRVNFNGVSAQSNVTLINGLQITNSIKRDKLSLEASKYDLKRSANDISLAIAQTYLNVIFNRELLENAEFQLESSVQQLEQTKILVESGALPVANQLQLESQVATNEVSLVNAQNNLDLALLDLKQSLLLPPGEEIDIVIPEITVESSDVESQSVSDIYKVALENQPEIKSAELSVESSSVGVDVSKGALYPSLSLSGSISTNYSDADQQRLNPFQNGFDTLGLFTQTTLDPILSPNIEGDFTTVPLSDQYDNNLNTRLTLNLSIPIFNGLSTKAGVERSKISYQQALISEKEQQNVLYQTIETSFRNALAASKTYESSLRQVASLEETYRAVENQYNNGAANFTDYQVAANNLFQAQSDLSRAKYDFIFRQKILDFYLGKPLSF